MDYKILTLAEAMDFEHFFNTYSYDTNDLISITFRSKCEELDEKDLRWTWYMDKADSTNLRDGLKIAMLLKYKQLINVINQMSEQTQKI
jgi:hypothetical protein